MPYILGEIKRFIRDDGPIKISRSIKELGTKIFELQRKYQIEKGREITIKEISEELKLPIEDVAMALEATNSVSSIEEATYTDNKTDKKVSLIDKIASNKDEATAITNKLTVKKMIEDLEEKDRQVILLRFYKEKTQTQVSKILGISQVQVSRIERKILDKMRKSLNA